MCVCLFKYVHIYIYLCVHVCLCASLYVSVCARTPSCLCSLWFQRGCYWGRHCGSEFQVQRSYMALLESVQHDITQLRVLVREIWMSGCYEQGTRKLLPAVWLPGQQISLQRMLFPQGLCFIWILGEGRRGILENVFGICKPFVARPSMNASFPPINHFWSREGSWSYSL